MNIKFTDPKGRVWEYTNVVRVEVDTMKDKPNYPTWFNFGYYDDLGEYHEECGDIPTGDIDIHVDESEVICKDDHFSSDKD